MADQAKQQTVAGLRGSGRPIAQYRMGALTAKYRAASHRWVAAPLFETLDGILFSKAPDAEFSGTGGPVLGGAKT